MAIRSDKCAGKLQAVSLELAAPNGPTGTTLGTM